MTGPATLAKDADAASAARGRLDLAAAAMDRVEASHRDMMAALVELWPSSAWLISGARTAKHWLVATTGASWAQAARLVRIAERCAAHPELADAVISGRLPFRRAELLGRVVTDERAAMLAGSLPAILELGCTTGDDDEFATALRYWAERVDEHTAPHRPLPHTLRFSQRLFGGGRIEGDLAPVAFDNVVTAVDAWSQDPDPVDGPYQRSLGERRADGLSDLARFSLTHTHEGCTTDDDEEEWARDTYDGTCPTDELDGLVLRGEGWRLAHAAVEQYRCDSALVATLFAGRTRVLDANTAAEQFSRSQRRAITAAHPTCVGVGCTVPAHRCDIHHVRHREHDGPTAVANGVPQCGYHHRLIHQHGWRLEQEPDGTWTTVDPHGSRFNDRRPPDQTV